MLKLYLILFVSAGSVAAAQTSPTPPAVAASVKYPSCAPSELSRSDYAVTARHDEFKGTTSYSSSDIPLDPQDDDGRYKLKAVSFPADNKTNYALLAMYIGKGWVFIGAEPMLLLLDGQKLSLPAVGRPTRDVWEGGEVYESQMYSVSASDAAAIAKASTVKIRLTGEKYIPDFTLPSKGACAFDRFVDERIQNSK